MHTHKHIQSKHHTCVNVTLSYIKASSHATYIYHVALSRCATTSQWNVVQLPIGMQIILLYTLIHNALSHSSNWLHTQGINLV